MLTEQRQDILCLLRQTKQLSEAFARQNASTISRKPTGIPLSPKPPKAPSIVIISVMCLIVIVMVILLLITIIHPKP